MSRFSRKALRAAFVVAVVLAAVAVVSPVASAKRRTLMPVCQPAAAHWISVNDDLGVPWLQFVPETRCTDATGASACPAGSLDVSWVGIVDELGIPYLVPTGSAGDGSCRSAAVTAPQPGVPLKSPYRGWVVVTDAQGTPKLVPLSDIR
ncbi:MAG TPA: hypothetical protein VMB53_00460 [Gaiellaceae bacterium]|nr:hypothetical protein [Gaiellaceae bacterium]